MNKIEKYIFPERIEFLGVDEVKLCPTNSKKHDIDSIVQSIVEFGFNDPIAVDENGEIIEGHGRLEAAKRLGVSFVPAITLRHLTEAQKKAYRIAHNKLTMLEGFDLKLLEAEFSALQELEFDLTLTGFDDKEIKAILPPEKPDYKEDPDEDKLGGVDGDTVDPVSIPGDVWILGKSVLICGDSRKPGTYKTAFPDRVGYQIGDADLVLTDPPYGVDIVKHNKVGNDKKVTTRGGIGEGVLAPLHIYPKIKGDDSIETAKDCFTILKDGLLMKRIIFFGGHYFTDFLPASRAWIVWDKKNAGDFGQVELAWSNLDRPTKLYTHQWHGLIREGSRKDELVRRVHPTQKPVGLFFKILEDLPDVKVVLDPFAGSGSILIACVKFGISCISIEFEPLYVDLIVNRYREFTGDDVYHAGTGESFGKTKEERRVRLS